jgi:hypothetical protein
LCVKKTPLASCCTEDEGGAFGAALWEEASNDHELLRSKAPVVNVMEKARRRPRHVGMREIIYLASSRIPNWASFPADQLQSDSKTPTLHKSARDFPGLPAFPHCVLARSEQEFRLALNAQDIAAIWTYCDVTL